MAEFLGGLWAYFIAFGVHGVVGDDFGGDGSKGAESDVEGEFAGGDAFLFEVGEKFGGEVEACGGCGGGSGLAGIDGLVALSVGGIFIGCSSVDIGGEWG